MKITCNVIKDLGELYAANMLSEDSKMIVEEHIRTCAKCKEYIEKSKAAFETVPTLDYQKIAEEKANIESLKDKVISKILPFVMMAIVVMTLVFVSINYVLFEHEIVVPYDGQTIYVTEDGFLHFPDCYDVAFVETGSSEYTRVQVETNYMDKIRGVEPSGEEVVDLKGFVDDRDKTQILYRDGLNEQVIWEQK